MYLFILSQASANSNKDIHDKIPSQQLTSFQRNNLLR